jgi:hypothetical protein
VLELNASNNMRTADSIERPEGRSGLLFDTLVPAPAYRLDPLQKPGEWLYLLGESERFTPGNQLPVSIVGLTFGTWGTFGHIEKRCWPNCPMDDAFKYSLTFNTANPPG